MRTPCRRLRRKGNTFTQYLNAQLVVENLDSLGNSSQSDKDMIDLVNCNSVIFQEEYGVSGVHYVTDLEKNEEGWTPVCRKCRGQSKTRDYSS